MIKANCQRVRVIVGRMSALKPEPVRNPVVHQPREMVLPRPKAGSQFMVTAKK